MTEFEKYLIDNGWSTNDNRHYSSLGCVCKVYENGSKKVVYGLGEPNTPPSYLAPLPTLKKGGYLTIPNFIETQSMISKYGNQRFLEAGLNNEILSL